MTRQKRASVGAGNKPSPKKLKAGEVEPEPAEPAVQELLVAYSALERQIKANAEKGAVDMGGLQAFDEVCYKKEMKTMGRYECLIPFAEIDLLAFTHRRLAPTLGSLKKMAQAHWTGANGQFACQSWSEAIVVRAISKTERPENPQTVSGDAYRVSFLWAWHEKHKAGGDTKDFQKGSRAMRVRYEYLPDDSEFELQKWRLADKSFTEADVQVLQGLKRAQAVKEVQAMLRAQGRADSAEGLEKFFGDGGVKAMSALVVGRMLKIADRFEAAGSGAALLVSDLDSRFGCNGHLFGNHTNLGILCQRTVVKKNDPVQNQLLCWVLQMVHDEVVNQKVDANMGSSGLQVLISRSLLKRRVVQYLARKFGSKDSPLISTFSTLESFKNSGLDGFGSLQWLTPLPEHEQQVAGFAARIIRGTAEIDQLMDTLLQRDTLLAPEACLLEFSRAQIYDHEGLLKQMEDHKAISEAPPAAPAAVPEAEPMEQAEALEPEPQAAESEEPEPVPGLDRLSFFPHLGPSLPNLFRDILQRNPDDVKYQALLDDAMIRRNTYVDLHVRPATSADLFACLKSSKMEGPKLFRVDPKTMSSKPVEEASGLRFYRKKCIVREGPFRTVVTAVLGDSKMQGESPFFFSSQDVMMLHDGRVGGNTNLMKKELKKALKDKELWGPRPSRCLLELRCLYHNREFLEGGFVLQRNRKAKHGAISAQSIVPEPLETVLLLQGKDAKLELKSRKWLDMPSDNSSKSMGGLSLKNEEARLLSSLPNDLLQAMAQGEDSASMLPGSDDDESGGSAEAEALTVQCLHPWEADETACRELLHGYAPPKATVVDFWAGCSMATACCRDRVRYFGFTQNEVSKAVIYEQVLLRIVLDMCLDLPDSGFSRSRRFLSRTASLGGADATASEMPRVESPARPEADASAAEVLSESGAESDG